jgi:TolB-like protein
MPLKPTWSVSGTLLTVAIIGCHHGQAGDISPEPRLSEADSAARQAVATEQSIDVATFSDASLGIPPFEVSIADTALAPLAYGLADLLITDLARSSQLQVVDRLRLDAVLREVQLVESGRVDAGTAPRVGKLIRARNLILGRLTLDPAGSLRIDARIADVATGGIRAGVDATAPLRDVLEAEKALALELFDRLGVTLTPAERAAVEQMPTRNVAALLAYSRGVRYQVEGRYEAAAAEYEHALQLDPGFSASAARSEEVRSAAPEGPAEASAGGEVSRAAGIAVDRVNGIPDTPIGSQQTEGPTDPSFPSATATVVITVTTP